MIRVCHTGQAKVTNFKVTCCVQQKVGRFQIPVQNVGRMNVLQASKNLVEKVANVIVAETLQQGGERSQSENIDSEPCIRNHYY